METSKCFKYVPSSRDDSHFPAFISWSALEIQAK